MPYTIIKKTVDYKVIINRYSELYCKIFQKFNLLLLRTI
jgi:hypothetical protein